MNHGGKVEIKKQSSFESMASEVIIFTSNFNIRFINAIHRSERLIPKACHQQFSSNTGAKRDPFEIVT